MTAIDTWVIANTRHDPHSLGQHNSVFTISNGYLGLKGNLCEDRDGYCPVTLIHGVYDELDMFGQIRCSNQERRYLDPRYFDTAGKSPAVANLPNPLFVRVFVGDEELSLGRGAVRDFHQILCLRSGVYAYEFTWRDRHGRSTRIQMRRLASMVHPHRVFMQYTVTAIGHDAPVRIRSGIDADVYSNTTRERQFSVAGAEADAAGRCILRARTPARGHDVHLGVVNVLHRPGLARSIRPVIEHDAVYTEFEFAPAPDEAIAIDRFVALTCSEDDRHGVRAAIEEELAAAVACGFQAACGENAAQWEELWRRADVQIDGDDRAQQYLRFCLFHLLQAAPRHTDRLSVPVKLLTGEYYQGNTFYDTDLYIEPFYLFTFPELARGHLHWRHLGLGPACEIARELGFAGAKFAWQAGPRGEECLGKWWRFTHTNIHINADVAYSLMQYYRATGDEAFLRNQGLDILVQTARFYASRAVYDASRDAYDIHDVAGPDEGHCESTNNFYTNYLAIRNLRWAAETVERLTRAAPDAYAAAVKRLDLKPDEPARWRHVAERLTLLFDPQSKVYEQCEGFYRLKPVPPDLLANRKAWFETVFPYQALNQPDVVMALVLFRDEFDADVRRANWEFYKDKSMNFSSMSFVINSIMAADMGEMADAYRHFLISAGQDLDEDLTGRKDTYAGLHGTAAGGAWMAAVFGFAGVHLSEGGLRIDPNLPPEWKAMRFGLVIRGQPIRVEIDRETVSLTAGDRPARVPMRVAGHAVTLEAGAAVRVRYRQ
jgi:kojibiose phosphorylase